MKRGVFILLLCLGFAASASAGPFTIYQGAPGIDDARFWVGFAPQPDPPIIVDELRIQNSAFWVMFAPQPEPPKLIGGDVDFWVQFARFGVDPSPFLFMRVQGYDGENYSVPLASYGPPPCGPGTPDECPPAGAIPFSFARRIGDVVPPPPPLVRIEVSFFGATTDPTGKVVPSADPLGLTLVPDPGSSLLLLGMGLAGLRAWKKRIG